MKATFHLIPLALFTLAATVSAQETPAATEPVPVIIETKPLDLMPAQDVTPAPMLPEANLIPDAPESTPLPERPSDSLKKNKATDRKSKTEIASDALALKIQYRKIKTRAQQDPSIQAEWERAEESRTDLEKRESLKRYYDLLFTRILKLDPKLKPEVALRKGYLMRRLEQTRIDGTSALAEESRALRDERVLAN